MTEAIPSYCCDIPVMEEFVKISRLNETVFSVNQKNIEVFFFRCFVWNFNLSKWMKIGFVNSRKFFCLKKTY